MGAHEAGRDAATAVVATKVEAQRLRGLHHSRQTTTGIETRLSRHTLTSSPLPSTTDLHPPSPSVHCWLNCPITSPFPLLQRSWSRHQAHKERREEWQRVIMAFRGQWVGGFNVRCINALYRLKTISISSHAPPFLPSSAPLLPHPSVSNSTVSSVPLEMRTARKDATS